ncbi:MAG: (deoxy)nucleoside triphosphate pyrophosphohydrolase [Spirochaetales bacterium]|nr:(deoxy)nucleoside triphosphate pyrophosphohydrolase [Spirochaetales bacterium]
MKSNAKTAVIRVTAGIIVKNRRVLLARRPRFSDLAGLWEFPGGKVENGESAAECLVRELAEELSIRIDPGDVERFDESFYEYGYRRILLIGMSVRKYAGVPAPVEHAQIRWVDIGALESVELAPADVPLARRLAGAYERRRAPL